ncbi:AraC family transcriptional regulator [Pelagicoccus sp. SDUM812003]|uniref:AraC family transcriptional regulator n=1 Tax=Pelagicoccus sp. SDUM812003 TaxID=3041267 RepID=UPI00280E02FE|nr:AraC family transcriptional regulator [Pelagicoccus sp. SDUM812003]MDQ8201370.1 AraC family transcriptional regulator [Pelagicoccus sp. SDUM812003]
MSFPIDTLRIDELFRFEMPAGGQPNPIGIPPGMIRVELMLEGGGWILDGNCSRRVEPGDLVLNQQWDETIYRAYPEKGYVCLSINIRLLPGVDRVALPRFCRWVDGEEHASHFAKRCEALFELQGFDQATLERMMLGEIFFQVEASGYWDERGEIPVALRKAIEYLDSNYLDTVSLASLAKVAGYSRSRFHELFLKYVGVTPLRYQRGLRLRRAKQLALQTTQPIKWIAAECGFSSAASFCSAFAKEVGMTPAEYRRARSQLRGG